MRDVMGKIKDFHERNGFDVGVRMSAISERDRSYLESVAEAVMALAKPLRDNPNNRPQRAGYVLEEAAELALALAEGDEVAILDALADLIYVVAGCGVTYGLPLPEAFDEIHRSNMSKTRRDSGDVSFRDKGADYVAPDLGRVIREARR